MNIEELKSAGAFICSYIGTIGMSHGLDIVLRASQILKNNNSGNSVAFLIAGDGAEKQRLETEARIQNLSNVHFLGLIPKDKVPILLQASDAALIHLKKKELFGTVIPSKLFELMAMNVPIIMGVEGEARKITLDANAGEAIEPENERDLLAAVERIKRNGREHYRGRDYVCRKYDRELLALDMLKIIIETKNKRN